MVTKEKYVTNLNAFFYLVKFICVIFYLFFHVVKFLSRAIHCSGRNIYDFGSILVCLVQSTNHLTLIVNYPNDATTIDIHFCRTLANFLNINRQPFFFVKTSNDFILTFSKGINWNLCFCKNGNNFVMEGIMGWIPDVPFPIIPINTSWDIRIVESRIRLNFFLYVSFVQWENIYLTK